MRKRTRRALGLASVGCVALAGRRSPGDAFAPHATLRPTTAGPGVRMPPFTIRDATDADLPAILAIYNDVIATSTAVFSLEPATLDDRRAWLDARRAGGYPVIVAAAAGEVQGFASFGEFRGAWHGYRYSVEHSVHVRADRRGHGVGSALVQALFPRAAAMRKHVMLGGIDAANEGSLRLHERLGFERVAYFREVGHKFGRWLDLVFVQRFVDDAGAARD